MRASPLFTRIFKACSSLKRREFLRLIVDAEVYVALFASATQDGRSIGRMSFRSTMYSPRITLLVHDWADHGRAGYSPKSIDATPPEGVTGDRWIDINLYDQTLTVYENRQLVFATLIVSGGEPFYTRPGLFQVYEKHETETMSGSFEADRSDYYYLENVPWTMYFDKARALHGAYWRAWFGYAGTHGCVNLSIGDSAWLFKWANVGEWVHVWDPSGETPTDPNFYGEGGA